MIQSSPMQGPRLQCDLRLLNLFMGIIYLTTRKIDVSIIWSIILSPNSLKLLDSKMTRGPKSLSG